MDVESDTKEYLQSDHAAVLADILIKLAKNKTKNLDEIKRYRKATPQQKEAFNEAVRSARAAHLNGRRRDSKEALDEYVQIE